MIFISTDIYIRTGVRITQVCVVDALHFLRHASYLDPNSPYTHFANVQVDEYKDSLTHSSLTEVSIFIAQP